MSMIATVADPTVLGEGLLYRGFSSLYVHVIGVPTPPPPPPCRAPPQTSVLSPVRFAPRPHFGRLILGHEVHHACAAVQIENIECAGLPVRVPNMTLVRCCLCCPASRMALQGSWRNTLRSARGPAAASPHGRMR